MKYQLFQLFHANIQFNHISFYEQIRNSSVLWLRDSFIVYILIYYLLRLGNEQIKKN